jgi:hypothetical protein
MGRYICVFWSGDLAGGSYVVLSESVGSRWCLLKALLVLAAVLLGML